MTDTRLHEADRPGQDAPTSGNRDIVIELTGLSRTARMALNNQPLVILYFPFRIGRLSRSDPSSTAKQDLLLPDFKPFYVSRNHVTFEKVNGTIFLVDETSTCGTVVDEVTIGGGQCRVELAPGPHIIAIGGPDSPFLFQAEVRAQKPSDFLALDGSIPDRLPQARLLYRKLCECERKLLAYTSYDPSERGRIAGEMIKVIMSRPELLGPLRCLASNPVSGSDYVAQHSVNIAVTMILLYRNCGFATEEIVKNAAAALLHDIGMSGIDPHIVLKAGPLTEPEYAKVKQHTIIGREKLAGSSDICALAASMARDHHERTDKSGYPRGACLLPENTRYMGILDSFEGLTHDRPQRQAFTPHEAVRILTARDSGHFDNETRKVFLNTFSFFPVSTIVMLSSGEIGRVVAANQDRPLSPQVRILRSLGSRNNPEGRLVDLSRENTISIVREVPDKSLAEKFVEQD